MKKALELLGSYTLHNVRNSKYICVTDTATQRIQHHKIDQLDVKINLFHNLNK
jgi:predicted GIY-YIG superfamily endonuclease